MSNITKVAEEMQRILGEVAEEEGRKSGLIKREVKLNGATFAQTLVFGWMSNPQATYEELSQAAATIGVEISAQALEQRFTEEAAKFLKQLLDQTIKTIVKSDKAAIPILERFNGIYMKDSSTITLPDELKDIWEGCGGSSEKGTSSALKMQVELDLSRGILVGPFLTNGKDADATSVLNKMILPAGSLQIGDLGYWSIVVFKEKEQNQNYFLSRYKTFTAAFDKEGKRWEIIKLLEAQLSSEVDIEIEIGVEERFGCRLLAARVPTEVAAERRRKWKAEAKREGKTLSKEKLSMADWSIFVTNVPQSLLTLKEALVLARARWQIELLFKLWKSYGQIDKSRSEKVWRVLCELYAKLIIMVIQHWILIIGCWAFPNRSLPKAVQLIQKHAFHLASAFSSFFTFRKALSIVVRILARCLINKRKSYPNSYQLLIDIADFYFEDFPHILSIPA